MSNKVYQKNLFVYLAAFILFVTGCNTHPVTINESLEYNSEINQLLNMDSYPTNVFIGISAPYSDNEKMLKEALYQCARSIAISEILQVSNSLVSEYSSSKGNLSFATEGKAIYLEKEITEILPALELIEIRGDSKTGLVVVAFYPEFDNKQRPFIQTYSTEGVPNWIGHYPVIQGYIVAIGDSLGYKFVKDSLEAADLNAARLLIEKSPQALTETRSYSISKTAETDNNIEDNFQGGILQKANGILQGFYVLARWYDSNDNHFYSLAVIPMNNSK